MGPHLRLVRFYSLAVLCGTTLGSCWAQVPQSGHTYAPNATTVAILPVVNKTGLSDDDEMGNLTKAVSTEIEHQLAGRGFKVITGKPIKDATTRLSIDLKDEEQHKRSLLRSVGREVGADMLAFVVITDVDSKTEGGLGISTASANAKIKCWLLDVGSERSLMSAKIEAARSDSGIRLGAYGGQFPKIIQACVLGVTHAFERVLSPYPFLTKDGRVKNGDHGRE